MTTINRSMEHIGVSLKFTRSLIEERGNRGLIEQDGVSLPKCEALAWIDSQIASGRTISSGCPTPNPDGSCPGHPRR